MTEIKGFKTKKEAKRYRLFHGGKVCYYRDERGRSKNLELYCLAVRFCRSMDPSVYPYCVYKERWFFG